MTQRLVKCRFKTGSAKAIVFSTFFCRASQISKLTGCAGRRAKMFVSKYGIAAQNPSLLNHVEAGQTVFGDEFQIPVFFFAVQVKAVVG